MTIPPLRRIVERASCDKIERGRRRKLVRLKLECHHTLFIDGRARRNAQHAEEFPCSDCQAGKRPRGMGKAALEKWGL